VTFGFDADLNEASAQALSAMLDWMEVRYEVDRTTALALASPAVDLRVTQIVNETWGVHAVLADDGLLAG
jgi:acetamidase/formamidase